MAQQRRVALAKRVTLACCVLDAFFALGKGIVGVVSGSRALLADGANSLSDVLSGLLTLWAWHLTAKPADSDHHYGHGKMETLGAALQGGVMIFFAFVLAKGAVLRLWGWWGGAELTPPESMAAYVALVATALKAIQASLTKRAARKTESALLDVKADDYSGDVGASLGVALSAFFAPFGTWGVVLDPLMSLVMAIFIFKSGVTTCLQAGHELADGADTEVLAKVCAVATDGVDDVIDCHNVKARRLGGYWAIDLDLTFEDDTTLVHAHTVAEEVTRRLKRKFGPDTLVRVHQEPLSQKADLDSVNFESGEGA